jgi:YhcH/YjgK/YiaL family protein
MIFDNIGNLKIYFKDNWADKALMFYERLTNDTKNGIYQIDGDHIFCKVLDYKTKMDSWVTESHQKYIDIQIPLEGQEIIEVYNGNNELEIIKSYNESTDCTFYKYPAITPACTQLLTAGFMGIYFRQDIHTTQIAVNNEISYIKKAVFKVSHELILN